jgi:hypothetical protein
MVPQMPRWKRWLGIVAVTLFTLMMVGLVYLSIRLCIFAAAPDETVRSRLLMLALAALLLVTPGRIAWVLLHRKWKTGTFRLSPEELAVVRDRCAKPRPLYLSILIAVLYAGVAGTWTYTAVTHAHHQTYHSFTAALWWITAGIWIYRVFKPAKCTIPPTQEMSS